MRSSGVSTPLNGVVWRIEMDLRSPPSIRAVNFSMLPSWGSSDHSVNHDSAALPRDEGVRLLKRPAASMWWSSPREQFGM
jgi:hypothetical protein